MVMKRLHLCDHIHINGTTLIASFYGMNLSPLPLAGEGNAFWYILFHFSGECGGAVHWVFRRIRWF